MDLSLNYNLFIPSWRQTSAQSAEESDLTVIPYILTTGIYFFQSKSIKATKQSISDSFMPLVKFYP